MCSLHVRIQQVTFAEDCLILHGEMLATSRGQSLIFSVLAALLGSLLLSLDGSAADPSQPTPEGQKGVLLLYGESRLNPAIVRVDESIRSRLEAFAPAIDLFAEHLDLSWSSSPRYEDQLVAYLRAKHEGRKLDVIVPVGASALRFVLRHRANLFSGASIVFCGVNPSGAAGLERGSGVTGVWMILEAGATLDAVLRLQPDTRRVVVVGGASALDQAFLEDVKQDLARWASPVEVSYLAGLPMDELRKVLSGLPPHTVVLFVAILRDGAGRAFVTRNALTMIARESKVPVYGLADTLMGHGIIGGRVISFEAQGVLAGEIVGRILSGEAVDRIAPVDRSGNVYIFDAHELRRWGLSESRLPPGSVVLNRMPSMWELYRWHVLAVVMLIAAQAVLIGGLLFYRARRRGAERSLEDRLNFEMLLSELSATFVDLPSGEVNKRIERDLRRIAEQLGLDDATLTELSVQNGLVNVIHAWSADGVPSVRGAIDMRELPWILSRVRNGEIVRFSRLDQLPEEAARDREKLAEVGARSGIVMPLVSGGSPIGVITFTAARAERDWPDELVQRLQLLAGIFSNGLIRMRGEHEVQRLRRDLTHVGRVATMGELTASLAHELNQPLTAILSNAQAAQLLLANGGPDAAELGEILSDIVEDDKRAGEVIRRLRALLKKGELEHMRLDLNEVIQEVVRLVHSDAIIRNVSIALDTDPAMPAVAGDRVQLQQVILNLIMNGLEAMRRPTRGDRRLLIRTQKPDVGAIRVSVRDSGSGIHEDDLSRIFEPFYTTKPDGMGMGLSIARSIIEMHGGHLWAENIPAGGAIFSFTLPVDRERRP
jgi:signal transduction histidine kinase/ABC-type uncharacterized transport system substrate-binding protein